MESVGNQGSNVREAIGHKARGAMGLVADGLPKGAIQCVNVAAGAVRGFQPGKSQQPQENRDPSPHGIGEGPHD